MARQKNATYITEQKPFPKRLRELMFEKKASQTDLAKYAECTRQAISLYASGQSTPDIDIIKKIAAFFDVTTDYLLGITDEQTKDINVKALCEELGLTELAIDRLKQFKYMGYNSILSKMIYNSSFISSLSQMNQLLTLNLKEGYHAIVSKADSEEISRGGKGEALIIDKSVIENVFIFKAKESMAAAIDEVVKEMAD